MAKLKGDARDYLNAKQAARRTAGQDDRQLKASTSVVQNVQDMSPLNEQGLLFKENQKEAALNTPLNGETQNQSVDICKQNNHEEQQLLYTNTVDKEKEILGATMLTLHQNPIFALDDQLVEDEGQVVKCKKQMVEGQTCEQKLVNAAEGMLVNAEVDSAQMVPAAEAISAMNDVSAHYCKTVSNDAFKVTFPVNKF